jgi:hypothetical protein
MVGMSKTKLKPSASLLRPNASLQRRILNLLADHDVLSARQITGLLLADQLDDLVTERQQWYRIRCEAGEGSQSMWDQSLHFYRCRDRLILSRSGKVKRALDKLTARGLVKREDVLVPILWSRREAYWWESRYSLTPLGMSLVNTLLQSVADRSDTLMLPGIRS